MTLTWNITPLSLSFISNNYSVRIKCHLHVQWHILYPLIGHSPEIELLIIPQEARGRLQDRLTLRNQVLNRIAPRKLLRYARRTKTAKECLKYLVMNNVKISNLCMTKNLRCDSVIDACCSTWFYDILIK